MKQSYEDKCDGGVKFDQNKLRYDLIPPSWFELLADITTYGAKKYTPYGWLDVEDGINRYYAAAMRHLLAYRSSETLDVESGLPHLAHAAWNCLALISLADRKKVRPGKPYYDLDKISMMMELEKNKKTEK